MTTVYRFTTPDGDFTTVGRLEKGQGLFVLRVGATTDQAFMVERAIKANQPVKVFAEVAGEIVLPATATRVRARPAGAGRVELAAIIG